MTYALRHPHVREGATRERVPAIRWPRNLSHIGLAGLLLSAWGGIVPFAGPAFGFHANGSPSWHWSFMNAMLYFVPGVVGMVASLAVIAHSRAHRLAARFSLGFLGLVLLAVGAWFILGPAAWAALGASGVPFAVAHTNSAQFVNQLGYNLGPGILLSAIGGMVLKAATGERQLVTAGTVGADGTERYAVGHEPVAADAGAGASNAERGRVEESARSPYGPAGAGAEPTSAATEPATASTRGTAYAGPGPADTGETTTETRPTPSPAATNAEPARPVEPGESEAARESAYSEGPPSGMASSRRPWFARFRQRR